MRLRPYRSICGPARCNAAADCTSSEVNSSSVPASSSAKPNTVARREALDHTALHPFAAATAESIIAFASA